VINSLFQFLEKRGLKAGEDFKVAFSPEKAIPNNTIYEMTHNARVIGGIDQESKDSAAIFIVPLTGK
jgi:UDP-N-acetyl-D-mannosaminuronic acid dehydrogenase